MALNNSLCCTSCNDVYQLLKSSDFILHDVTAPFDGCDDASVAAGPAVNYVLILRKWEDINPGHEYRCFVKDHDLIGKTYYT